MSAAKRTYNNFTTYNKVVNKESYPQLSPANALFEKNRNYTTMGYMHIKTFLLLGLLTGLILAAGYYLGGQNGLTFALIFAALINFISYWFSDKIVLNLYRAKLISEAENPSLHQIVKRLCLKIGFPKPRLYLINLPVPNAFATGRNKNHAAIAVTAGILKLLNEKELEGVLAHELSHIKNRDILISSIAATLAGAISYLAQLAYFATIFSGGRRNQREGGNVIGALALIIVTPIIATLIHLAISRSREFLADETGAKIAGDYKGLANGLLKLHQISRQHPLIGKPQHEATAHLFIVNPFKPSLIMTLFSTHPSVEERVKRLEKLNFN